MACGWCVTQTLLLTRGPTSYHHLPATASSGKCFFNTFTEVHELKQFFKLTLRDPHLLEIKLSLQPSLVADSSPHHGSPLMVNCSRLKTQDTRIFKNWRQHHVSFKHLFMCNVCVHSAEKRRIHQHHLCRPLGSSRPFLRLRVSHSSSFSCGATHLY